MIPQFLHICLAIFLYIIMFYIYAIINTLNSRLYIGKTNNLKRRWSEHKKISNGGKEKYQNEFRSIHAAINKYGIQNFQLSLIEEIEDEKSAYDLEKFYISHFNSRIEGYNETPGGDGFLSGELHPFYGKHHSEETKQKLKKAREGKQPTLGYKASKETKIKQSQNKIGDKNPMYGKSHTDQSKLLISKSKLESSSGKGEAHYKSILTKDQVIEIRRLFLENNKTKTELSKMFNVSWQVIHQIITKQTYKY